MEWIARKQLFNIDANVFRCYVFELKTKKSREHIMLLGWKIYRTHPHVSIFSDWFSVSQKTLMYLSDTHMC